MIKRTLILLDRLYWLWLILATPFLLFPTPKRSLAMLVIPALFLFRWLAMKAKPQSPSPDIKISDHHHSSAIPITPLNSAMVLIMVMVLVSLWATFDINFSLSKICGLVLGWGFFFAFTRAGQTSRGWWFSFFLFQIIGVSIATIGLLGTNWLTKINFLVPIISRLPPRIKGLPGATEGFQPNTVAGTLLWVIPCLFTFFWFLLIRRRDLPKLIGRGRAIGAIELTAGVTLYMLGVLILTQSREGYISAAVTLPIMALIALPPKKRRYGLMILILLVILSSIAFAAHREEVQNWVLGNYQTTDPALSLESIHSRQQIWSVAIYGIRDFPLTGMGMDTFRKIGPVLYPLANISSFIDIGHAHNEFLQAALDLGIPGLIAFVAIYIVNFWMLIQIWQKTRGRIYAITDEQAKLHTSMQMDVDLSSRAAALLEDGWCIRMLALGLAGGLIAHLLWGLTDAIALGARPSFLFWILVGLICGLYQHVHPHQVSANDSISPIYTKHREQV